MEDEGKAANSLEDDVAESPNSEPEVADDDQATESRDRASNSRAWRFGAERRQVDDEKVKSLASLPAVPEGRIRHEAVHLHGVDEMSTEDVLELFSLYNPTQVEWINDKSCNVVWGDEASAQRALIGVGQQPVKEEVTGESGREHHYEELNEEEKEKQKIAAVMAKDDNTEERGEGEIAAGGRVVSWWLVAPHEKSEQLLVRQATWGDIKLPGAAQRSQYYKKYGNPNLEPVDLRQTLCKKRRRSSEGGDLGGEGDKEEKEMDTETDPLTALVKRPKPMHADRDEDEEEEEEGSGENGGRLERRESGGREGGADLRSLLKKKRKRRDLQMRLGSYPRLVEEHI